MATRTGPKPAPPKRNSVEFTVGNPRKFSVDIDALIKDVQQAMSELVSEDYYEDGDPLPPELTLITKSFLKEVK